MALKFKSCRSKSTSNIVDEIVNYDEKVMENSSADNRYRTYTIKDLKREKKYFAKTSSHEREREKGPPTQKSQNFLKKWIASLEKRNEVCKADDEFVAKYYRRNDYATPNLDCFYNNSRHQSSNRIERNDCNHRRVKMSEKCSINCKLDIVSKNKPTVSANRKVGDQFLFENYGKSNDVKESIFQNLNREKKVFRTYNQNKSEYRDENYARLLCDGLSQHSQTHEADSQREFGINENYKKKRFHNCSSFDPSRTPVELDNRSDSLDSRILRTSNTLERIITNSKEESDATPNGRFKKKRQRSFKDFFGSMVGWKKSEIKERPRRFMSCDHLMNETKAIDSKNVKILSRASSLKAVMIQNENEDNCRRIGERQATIHPIYGRKRTEQLLGTLARNKKKLFGLDESVENLVKPSAIKDIVKRLSQLPENLQTNDNFYETETRSIIEKRY